MSSTKKRHNLVFGRPLSSSTTAIPAIVRDCVEYLETPGKNFLSVEGLFRQSGHQNLVLDLKSRYDKGEKVDLAAFAPSDPHAIAGLLKLWLRELPEALLTFDMYDMFIAAIAVQDIEVKAKKIRQVFDFIPKQNLVLLKYLVSFLTRVAALSAVNMMKPSNISIVFGPNILRPSGGDISVMLEDSGYANELMTFMIEHCEMLFQGLDLDPDAVLPPSSEPSEPPDSPTEHKSSKASAVKFLNKAARTTAHKASKARKAAMHQAHKIGNLASAVVESHDGSDETDSADETTPNTALSTSGSLSSSGTPPLTGPKLSPSPSLPQPQHVPPPVPPPTPQHVPPPQPTPPIPKDKEPKDRDSQPTNDTPHASPTIPPSSSPSILSCSSPSTRTPVAPPKQLPPPPPHKLPATPPPPHPAHCSRAPEQAETPHSEHTPPPHHHHNRPSPPPPPPPQTNSNTPTTTQRNPHTNHTRHYHYTKKHSLGTVCITPTKTTTHSPE